MTKLLYSGNHVTNVILLLISNVVPDWYYYDRYYFVLVYYIVTHLGRMIHKSRLPHFFINEIQGLSKAKITYFKHYRIVFLCIVNVLFCDEISCHTLNCNIHTIYTWFIYNLTLLPCLIFWHHCAMAMLLAQPLLPGVRESPGTSTTGWWWALA